MGKKKRKKMASGTEAASLVAGKGAVKRNEGAPVKKKMKKKKKKKRNSDEGEEGGCDGCSIFIGWKRRRKWGERRGVWKEMVEPAGSEK